MTSPLLQLQKKLRKNEWFLVPRTDAFQGEYVAPQDERLAWVSGFKGSAGVALIRYNQAFLFVDGRYILQAKEETDPKEWRIIPIVRQSLENFLKENLREKQILSLNPWLHTLHEYLRLKSLAKEKGAALNLQTSDPIEALWQDRPYAVLSPAVPHCLIFSGKSSGSKREQIFQQLQQKVDAILFTDCHSIAWLLNIRGQDTPHTPIIHSYAVLHQDQSVDLFVDLRKITPQIKDYLGQSVRFHPLENTIAFLNTLYQKQIMVDPHLAPLALVKALEEKGTKLVLQKDPSMILRIVKNAVEVIGAVSAHIRDGVALTRFLCWLANHPSLESLTEIKAADRLEAFRSEGTHFRGLSFSTISAVGSHGAIVHYHPLPETDRPLQQQTLYLFDSGAQYLDGTTDVTRTIAFGTPTPEQRHHFTLVLKGHIALARARFPYGTTGGQLDVLARQYLWQEGLDYAHGTGHGVGSYLSVHEGPQRISGNGFQQKLLPGMILSNEPGYYKEDAYGIRIESLVLVRECRSLGRWLEFSTLTLAPIDRCLVESSLLTLEERNWLNTYHQRVYDVLASWLNEENRRWLASATLPITT